MKKFKTALVNNVYYCKFPDNIKDMNTFIKYLNENYHSFVELEFYIEKGCVAPFFIEEDLAFDKQYFNSAHIRLIKECEVFVLHRWEYEDQLKKVVSEKCIHCANYSEDIGELNLSSYMERIDLNGNCSDFELKK